MRGNLLLVFTLLCGFSLLAQRQADNIINGDCFQNPEIGNCDPPNANSVYRFNDSTLEEIIEPLDLSLSTDYSRAAYSDSAGNLAFASNGWRLVNNSGVVLSEKLWFDWIPHPGDSPETTNVLNSLGPLFLNDPGNEDRAYLFYGQFRSGNFGPEILKADVVFTYAYLDVPNRALISQNNLVLTDTSVSGDMQACRHANGRDWWLIKPGIYEDEYYIGLLSPAGISEMEKITIPGINHRGQFETYSYFSFDGLKFLHFTGKRYKYLHEYDFDRCSGTLSNAIVHDLTDSIPWGDHNACTISSDGSKFYIRRSLSSAMNLDYALLQYDLSNSTWTNISSELTASPQMAPNGKEIILASFIYLPDTTLATISRILHPNLPGLACEIESHTDTIQNYNSFISPSNFANFRLGPIDGSSCDTLGINSTGKIQTVSKDLSVFPNPAKDMLHVRLKNHSDKSELIIRNIQGALIYSSEFYLSEYINLEQLNIGAGLYFIEVRTGSESFRERFIYAR